MVLCQFPAMPTASSPLLRQMEPYHLGQRRKPNRYFPHNPFFPEAVEVRAYPSIIHCSAALSHVCVSRSHPSVPAGLHQAPLEYLTCESSTPVPHARIVSSESKDCAASGSVPPSLDHPSTPCRPRPS